MNEDLLTEMRLATDAIERFGDANRRHNAAQADETAKLWQAVAELRDEINAAANRLEALTSFVTTEPVEVAEKIVRLRDADA